VAAVTAVLALATIVMAISTRQTAKDTKTLAQVAEEEARTLREQNQILKNQFDASIQPVIAVYPAASASPGTFGPTFDIVVKNIGDAIARELTVDISTEAGARIISWSRPAFEPDQEDRQPIRYDPAAQGKWKVSVKLRDILRRQQPEISEVVEYPVPARAPQDAAPATAAAQPAQTAQSAKLDAGAQPSTAVETPREPSEDIDGKIESLLTQIEGLSTKKSDASASGVMERPGYVNDEIKSLELHGRVLYLTTKKQVRTLDEISKSSKRLEKSTKAVVLLALFSIGLTFFFSLLNQASLLKWPYWTLPLACALIILTAFVYTGLYAARKL